LRGVSCRGNLNTGEGQAPHNTPHNDTEDGKTMDVIDLRPGTVFELNNVMYTVMETSHSTQSRGRGHVRVKSKELKTGKTIERVFRSDIKVNQVYVEEMSLVYLYRDGKSYYFMDNNTYEQISLNEEMVGERKNYLKENLEVAGLFHNGKILDIKLPLSVDLKVIEAEPGFKGNTVQGGKKKVKVETKVNVQVPLFIEVDDIIKVDTRTGEYITRVG